MSTWLKSQFKRPSFMDLVLPEKEIFVNLPQSSDAIILIMQRMWSPSLSQLTTFVKRDSGLQQTGAAQKRLLPAVSREAQKELWGRPASHCQPTMRQLELSLGNSGVNCGPKILVFQSETVDDLTSYQAHGSVRLRSCSQTLQEIWASCKEAHNKQVS